jgi:hypothetical protein
MMVLIEILELQSDDILMPEQEFEIHETKMLKAKAKCFNHKNKLILFTERGGGERFKDGPIDQTMDQRVQIATEIETLVWYPTWSDHLARKHINRSF